MKLVYLDSAATTLIKPPTVTDAVTYALESLSSPGRGGYPAAMAAADKAYECREKAAALFNVSEPENVVFTFNATHGLNIAIKTLLSRGGRAVVSGYEHNSVMRPLHALGARITIAASPLFDYEAALDAFYREIRRGADAVICNHVSNAFGAIMPVYEIASMCREKGIPFILDASQSAGTLKIDAAALDAAFIAMPGHKGLYGPQGTGLLLCGATPNSLLQGGTGSSSISRDMPDFLPDALEAGTHNMPGISGLSAGLEYVLKRGEESILDHERALITRAYKGLSAMSGVTAYGGAVGSYAGVLSFTVDGMTCELVGEALAERGIAVRTGLHCAPEAHRSAGTLDSGTVRISVSAFTSERDIDVFLAAMVEILTKK